MLCIFFLPKKPCSTKMLKWWWMILDTWISEFSTQIAEQLLRSTLMFKWAEDSPWFVDSGWRDVLPAWPGLSCWSLLCKKSLVPTTLKQRGAEHCSKVSGKAECMGFKIPSSDCGESCWRKGLSNNSSHNTHFFCVLGLQEAAVVTQQLGWTKSIRLTWS